MILVIGSGADPVLARAMKLLRLQGSDFALLEESSTGVRIDPAVIGQTTGWRIRGSDCWGTRPVTAVLIRRGPMPGGRRRGGSTLPTLIDKLLLSTACDVVNRPSSSTSNYSKTMQLMILAAAGFRVPRTLVTSVREEAFRFAARLRGDVIFKGISSVKTVPQVLQPQHLQRFRSLSRCPVQFQEQIHGADWRVTVVGDVAFASETRSARLVRIVKAAEALPRRFVERCIESTRVQGMVVSGIDVRVPPTGRPVVFEMNPFPLITHYEREEDPVISKELCRYLGRGRQSPADMFA